MRKKIVFKGKRIGRICVLKKKTKNNELMKVRGVLHFFVPLIFLFVSKNALCRKQWNELRIEALFFPLSTAKVLISLKGQALILLLSVEFCYAGVVSQRSVFDTVLVPPIIRFTNLASVYFM